MTILKTAARETRARSERAFLAELNYTNFVHIRHESFLGRSQNTHKIGKIQVGKPRNALQFDGVLE